MIGWSEQADIDSRPIDDSSSIMLDHDDLDHLLLVLVVVLVEEEVDDGNGDDEAISRLTNNR